MVTLLSILLIYSAYFVSRFTRELSLSHDSEEIMMNTIDVPPLEKLSNKINKDSNSELIVEEGALPEEQPQKQKINRECKQVYFWGGGKAGSSTMYSLIMHAGAYFHNSTDLYRSPFIDVGKEYCWVEGQKHNVKTWRKHIKGKCNINNDIETLTLEQRAEREKKGYVENEFVLDGCPRLTFVKSAEKILDESGPNTKFIMLIRDPIERLISHLNDQRRRQGAKYNVEDQIKKLLLNKRRRTWEIQLSMYGENLQNLLTAFSKVQQQQQEKNILIVRTETINATHTQDVFDAINDHIGAKRRVVEKVRVVNRSNQTSGKYPDYVYQGTISEQTRDALKKFFYSDVELLEKLVGRRFPWSWVDHTKYNSDSNVIDMSPWTTALV